MTASRKTGNATEILIAEDSPTQAEQLKYLLEQNGYQVTAAADGLQALAALQQHPPQLVISDIVMPGMDGYALCRAIKSDDRLQGIPVMLVTSLSDVQDVMKGLESGADNFIRKPYDEKYLLAHIDYLLVNQKLRKNQKVQMGMEIYLQGQRHFITVEQQQIFDLLISIYEEAVHMNKELAMKQEQLTASNQSLNGLYLIAEGLNQATSEQDVVEQAVARALELPGVESSWIWLREGESGFRLAASRNFSFPPESPATLCHCQRQVLAGGLDSASNIVECERLRSREKHPKAPLAHISVPLGPRDSPLGVMNLAGPGGKLFNDAELKIAHGIGQQVEVALMRAQLHAGLEKLVELRTAALKEEIVEREQAQADLRRTEARLESILSSMEDVVYSIAATPPYAPLFLNPAAASMYGRPVSDFFAAPDLWREMIHPGDKERVLDCLEAILVTGMSDLEYRIVKQDGEVRWLHDRTHLVHDDAGAPLRLDGIIEDITERKLQEAKMLRLNRVYAVLSGINTAIVHIREQGQLLEAACRIATEAGGFKLAWIGMADMEAKAILPVAFAGTNEGYLAELKLSLSGDAPRGRGPVVTAYRERQVVVRNDIATDPAMAPLRVQALERGFRAVAAFPLLVEGKALGVFALYAGEPGFFDEEELQLLTEMAGDTAYALENIDRERQLDYLAFHDKVTDLPNRALLVDRLGQLLPQAAQDDKKLAVLALDIDRFKFINDSLGYQAGDHLLRKVAERLRGTLPDANALSRGIGDEFAVVLTEIRDLTDIAEIVADGILAPLSNPFDINGEELRITLKVGASVFPGDASDAETLLKTAEVALDKAKHSMDAFLFYSPEMNASVARTLTIENKLRKAIERREFILHYQPKIELGSGRICGMEALIRWQDPDNGMVSPTEFIPILEETGMILDVGRWVIETACRHCRQWQEKGWQVPPLALNVSSLQLTQEHFVDEVRGFFAEHRIAGKGIEFEITESVIMKEVGASIDKLEALRELGASIAIDDFGTGYSSLSYLTRLPLSRLKIDKSFITKMDESADSLAIVSSIISLAHTLDLKVIAEGVETGEQLKLLKLLKCDEIQGYIAYTPLPVEKIEEILAEPPIPTPG